MGRVVILDTRGLKEDPTIRDMREVIRDHGWEDDVIWYDGG